ncbi:hypothetical protein I3760_01G086200 [Carya illinoinensis]|uniref:uncharacterized protein LOC122313226 isoform X1 n=1 Tax=Carya illinoinensis TaxID=32201 RepID=UPI001BF8E3F1|nr:uncharacterized protein LOC122313226 isoform X1 [Carya illinoinensis]XP_042983972.1 uncharacterized protein LOC122313226 isoform X1 [Carya illinoinensis]XP_042983982.1 uncharacterized protein LOC122313226 isoform X1 [Carya illinoinensis]XP_042983990.1 uncharacterized protein LOC122313226 isoform X1 [Carya illinoinensis]XP_042983998.1 uncharacterized protein LOC122313226 isoform X1 [Carya illinoinensis]KAG2725858.1 hypothetical protein I3760_01G086200 [Carya illinoinensis]KAG2725859.1 hypot
MVYKGKLRNPFKTHPLKHHKPHSECKISPKLRRCRRTATTTAPRTRSYLRYFLRSGSRPTSVQVRSSWKNFKTWGCPRYEELCAIFGCAVATGTMHCASTDPPPDSDDERLLDEEMRNRGQPVIDDGGGPSSVTPRQSATPFSTSYASGSRRRQRGGPTMDEGLQKQMTDTLEEIRRSAEVRREAVTEVMESSRSRKRSKGEHSMEFDGAFDLQMHCMKLLEEVQPPLSTEQFNKAFDRLLLTKVQRSFVSISEDRRSKWAWSLK